MAAFNRDDELTPKLEGLFWLPSNPDHRWPGVLQFHSSGFSLLTLWMLGGGHLEGLYAKGLVLLGEVNEIRHRRVTLAGGHWTRQYGDPTYIGGASNFEFSHTTLWLDAESAALEEWCPIEEIPVTANEFRFTLEGLESWLGRKQWDSKDGRSFAAKEHAGLSGVRVTEGVDASLRVLSAPDWFGFGPGFRIDTCGEVVLRSDQPREIGDFIELAERFQRFMCFVWRRQCLIGEMCLRWANIRAEVRCPTWLSWFPSDGVDELLPAGTAFTAKEVGPATPNAVLEAWCRMCSESAELVESIVRVLADSRSTDQRIDLVLPALDQLAPRVAEKEPEWRRGEREKMLAALDDEERREWWDERMQWAINPMKSRLAKLFKKYAGASVTAAERERVVSELVEFRVQRFHKGFHAVSDDVWFPAVAVLYCAVLDKLGIDWRCFMKANGTLRRRRGHPA
ncbi:MAG: hypothetical protein OXP74_15965 [Acidobacteriota bacterium]|nr:hypothetical protein [Acidobacteriota bacterium]